MARLVTVAIPVLNGGALLREVLTAVRAQAVDAELELLVADSGSSDGSAELADALGARVLRIPPGSFSHGGTRNQLMREARGAHVAFLTQDAVPADDHWLARLLRGFELGDDIGLSYGPYLPRPDASHMVARELSEFFRSFAPSGEARVDRGLPPVRAPSAATFFTDANGAVARSAWEHVPFREVAYAEDQLLAWDMLAAGYAKAFVPDAGVVHSHDYPPLARFRRFFDEWRGLREVYGHVEPAGLRHTAARVRREVREDRHYLRAQGAAGTRLARGTLESLAFHLLRAAGSAAGSRADRLPAPVRRRLSLEGRATFEPVPELAPR